MRGVEQLAKDFYLFRCKNEAELQKVRLENEQKLNVHVRTSLYILGIGSAIGTIISMMIRILK